MKRRIFTFSCKYAALLVFALLSYNASSQCSANFIISEQGLTYQFVENSTIAPGDSIITRLWDFGDGEQDSLKNVSHTYQFPNTYEVTLFIATANGCNAFLTKEIVICDINLDVTVGSTCFENDDVNIAVSIQDTYSVVDSVFVFLDNVSINPTGFALENVLNLNLAVPGDGLQHVIRVETPLTFDCTEIFTFVTEDCNAACFLSNMTIDDAVNELHLIEVAETEFLPANRIIRLGDLVKFVWTADSNSTVSETEVGIDSWNSGVLDSGAIYDVVIKNPGIKPYYSSVNGSPGTGMNGNIIANCPLDQSSPIEITFDHTQVPPGGFYLKVDDIVINDSIYQYNTAGQTTITFELPGDNINHNIKVVDFDEPECYIEHDVQAINCNGSFPCALNIEAIPTGRCDIDSLVEVTLNISGISPSDSGLVVLLDGAFSLDTLFFDETNTITVAYDVPGDGNIHKFSVRDIGVTGCMAETTIGVRDCADPCDIFNLQVGTGSISTLIVSLDNDGIFNDDIVVAAGDDVLFQWTTDSVFGIRSLVDPNNTFDSGLRPNGSIYLIPVMPAGVYVLELYNVDGQVVDTANLVVLASCDDNSIPVFYSFIDLNGSPLGYDVYLDDTILANSPFHYAFDGNNSGALQIEGDDELHSIEIRDRGTNECFDRIIFFAPECEEFTCDLELSISFQDTCFNDNTKPFDLSIYNPNPLPNGFTLGLNDEVLGPDVLFYDTDSITVYSDILLADSSTYVFTIADAINPICKDTLIVTVDSCITNCVVSNLELFLVNGDYADAFPDTPEELVGCQSDSTFFIAAHFLEKYSDSDNYSIFVDGFFYDGDNYADGDGINITYIPVLGDSLSHTISIIDNIDQTCTVEADIVSPKCFSDCRIIVESFDFEPCVGDSSVLEITLADNTTSPLYSVTYDNNVVSPVILDTFTLLFSVYGDSLPHTIALVDINDENCADELSIITPYCLTCDIQSSVAVTDSCSVNDSIYYVLDLQENSFDSIEVTFLGATSTVTTDLFNNYAVKGDGSNYEMILQSVEDQYCSDTLLFTTEDCTPIICEADFVFEVDGLTAEFTDVSVTSEPITSQSWNINGVIQISNVSSFTFTFDSVAVYNVCHSITTDSCTSTSCRDVFIDPCTDFDAFFTSELVEGGFQFTNMSSGNFESIQYSFGDGSISEESNPYHEYTASGVYTVCLVIQNVEFDCFDEHCEEVSFTVSSKDININDEIKVFPNPVSEERILSIESKIDIEDYKLFDTNGNLIFGGGILKNTTVNIRIERSLPSGIYILHMKSKEGEYQEKIYVK